MEPSPRYVVIKGILFLVGVVLLLTFAFRLGTQKGKTPPPPMDAQAPVMPAPDSFHNQPISPQQSQPNMYSTQSIVPSAPPIPPTLPQRDWKEGLRQDLKQQDVLNKLSEPKNTYSPRNSLPSDVNNQWTALALSDSCQNDSSNEGPHDEYGNAFPLITTATCAGGKGYFYYRGGRLRLWYWAMTKKGGLIRMYILPFRRNVGFGLQQQGRLISVFQELPKPFLEIRHSYTSGSIQTRTIISEPGIMQPGEYHIIFLSLDTASWQISLEEEL